VGSYLAYGLEIYPKAHIWPNLLGVFYPISLWGRIASGSFLGKLEEESFLEKVERGYSHPSNS